LVYTDPLFRMTSDLAQRVVRMGRFRGVIGDLLRRPLTLFQVAFALWRLPVVDVTVRRSHAAVWFAPVSGPLGLPIFGGRLAQAVLDLGPDDQEYLVGRRKQALRTNLSHARRLGVHVERIETFEEWVPDAQEILRHVDNGPEMIQSMQPPAAGQDIVYFVASDCAGCPVAFAVAVIFDDCAVLVRAISLGRHPVASSARYLVHTCMRSHLRHRGVRQLIAGTAIRDASGLQYFQYLLGYEVRNLHLTVISLAGRGT
jgi:hypothetical protein